MRNEKVETGKSFISRHLKSIVLIVLCIAASVSFVFAAVLFSSHVKGNTDFGTGAIVDLENNALVAHSVTVEQAELKFSKAGDQVDFKVRITNNSDANLHYYYGVSVGVETAANGLSGAILVYYDGEFIDTLAHLCQNGEGRIDGDDFVMAKGSAAEESAEHLITFQLHIAAEASVFDKKSVDVKVISYTETADYQKYIFVRDEAGFQKAVDDINSGLLSDVTVVVNGKNFSFARLYDFAALYDRSQGERARLKRKNAYARAVGSRQTEIFHKKRLCGAFVFGRRDCPRRRFGASRYRGFLCRNGRDKYRKAVRGESIADKLR